MLGIIVRGILGVLLLALIVPALPRPHADTPDPSAAVASGPSPGLPTDALTVSPNSGSESVGAGSAERPQSASDPLGMIGSTVSYATQFCSREPRSCEHGLDALSAIGDRIRGPLISAVYDIFGGSSAEQPRQPAPAVAAAPAAAAPTAVPTEPVTSTGTLSTADRALPWQQPGSAAVR